MFLLMGDKAVKQQTKNNMNKNTEIKREYFLGEEREDRTSSHHGDWDYYYFADVTVVVEGKYISAKCHCGYVWSDSGGTNFAETDYDLGDLIDVDEFQGLKQLFRVIRKGELGILVDVEHTRWPRVMQGEHARNEQGEIMVVVPSSSAISWVSDKNDADEYQEIYSELVGNLLSEKIKAFKL